MAKKTSKRPAKTRKKARKKATKKKAVLRPSGSAIELREVDSLRQEIDRIRKAGGPPRWNADADEVRRAVLKLVLTLVEFIRQLLERQAIRRMEVGTLNDAETEAIGLALMRLEETVKDLCVQFDIPFNELNLDLGPIGKLV